MIRPGSKVRILRPQYVAGRLGTVLSAETDSQGVTTGYWIVSVDDLDVLVALLPEEMSAL
ncbi:MAG: hypothetical protein AAFU71_16465 [Cyanobacteria bacterium J06632_22]